MRRTLVGQVVSNTMDKTVVVRVERLVQNPRYKKYVRRYSKFMAHDESNACNVGDRDRSVGWFKKRCPNRRGSDGRIR
ncbi:MAG: 30S ribosomal protein S17 [Deltaproteobacteria bacterium]|nr:30S ribosomal protein S17 [Deltaproteobacteria bacterium]